MRFFSRLTFLCNICFIIMVIMRYVEIARVKDNSEAVVKLPYIQNTLIVLGWTAVFLNLIFVIITVFLFLFKKTNPVPRWIIIINLLIFAWQIAYHFNFY